MRNQNLRVLGGAVVIGIIIGGGVSAQTIPQLTAILGESYGATGLANGVVGAVGGGDACYVGKRVIDHLGMYKWYVNGLFGSARGTVTLSPGFTVQVLEWTNNRITIAPRRPCPADPWAGTPGGDDGDATHHASGPWRSFRRPDGTGCPRAAGSPLRAIGESLLSRETGRHSSILTGGVWSPACCSARVARASPADGAKP